MRFGSLFAGIGGFDLGLERAGMECVWQVEIDDYCNKVLAKHWPEVKRYRDVREVGKENLEPVELICGGFPCQDVSLAGKRKGLKGKRSTLWSEFYRVVCEIRPRWIAIENVPGLYSSDDGRFFTKILRELAEGGYDAEWTMLPAAAFGALHIRQRVLIVAYPKGVYGDVIPSSFCPKIPHTQLWGKQPRGSLDDFSLSGEPEPRWTVYESGMGGVDSRIPNRVDRLRALGNAVVPQVAEWIGRQIVAVESL